MDLVIFTEEILNGKLNLLYDDKVATLKMFLKLTSLFKVVVELGMPVQIF